MRKIFTILICMVGFAASAQSVNNTPTKFANGIYTPNGSTQPATSVQGGLWFNPTTLKLGIHNGTAYLNLLSETLAGTTYQTLANLQANLTASATAYPSVNAVNTGLALKANLASPTFTGTPTLPTGTIAITQAAVTNNTTVATTAYVTSAIAAQMVNVLTSATTLTLSSAGYYTFQGSSATTWTLPVIAGNTGVRYLIMNTGTADITLNTNGGLSVIYSGSLSNNQIITAGEVAVFYNNSQYWVRQL